MDDLVQFVSDTWNIWLLWDKNWEGLTWKNVFRNVFCYFLVPLSCSSGAFLKIYAEYRLNPWVLRDPAVSVAFGQFVERRLPHRWDTRRTESSTFPGFHAAFRLGRIFWQTRCVNTGCLLNMEPLWLVLLQKLRLSSGVPPLQAAPWFIASE